MRVLWFTNDPLPAVRRRGGRASLGSGGWMPSLLESLVQTPGIHVDVVTVYPGLRDDQFTDDGVEYFVIGQPRLRSFFTCANRDLERARRLVLERAPDLVHIHGTERFYGLLGARKLVPMPCVISVQGLLQPILSRFFGALSAGDLWRSQRLIELATRRGLLWRYVEFYIAARREAEILACAESLMGRTDWDRAHVRSVNPHARYYHVGEVLRKDFDRYSWDRSRCDPHTIIFTNAGAPYRGAEILLRALPLILREFPAARLRLAGGLSERRGYDRFLRRTTANIGLSGCVEFLGPLDGNAMARELSRAHVFAISSYIENSPNSLCEAMRVGLPCVASYTGGIPSLVEHGRTGLLFPPGDAPSLADHVIRLFRDDDLAWRIGRAARTDASERHDPQRVVGQLLNAYNAILRRPDHSFQDSQDTGLPPATSAELPMSVGAISFRN